MKRSSLPAAVLIFALLAISVCVSITLRPDHRNSGLSIVPPPRTSPSLTTPAASPNPGIKVDRHLGLEQSPEERILETLATLRAANTTPEETREILSNLRDYLGSLPPSVASETMVLFLTRRSSDTKTGLGFGIGANGFLKDHPSLRVALLDWLGQIDLKAAGMVAGQILSSPTSADEWCVSLRNYARSKPTSESFGFLRTKTEELILNPDWRNSPTVGYFESFDVLVYSRATESTALLAGLVSDLAPGNRSFAHASFVTLDRLVLQEPAEMFRQFAALPELTRARGPMVANMLARADLRDEEQQNLVRSYLLDPGRSQQELEGFAEAYPNANRLLSQNLLTGNKTPDHGDLIAHDRAVLGVVDGWSKEPSFQRILPHIETMRNRLTAFVGQAGN